MWIWESDNITMGKSKHIYFLRQDSQMQSKQTNIGPRKGKYIGCMLSSPCPHSQQITLAIHSTVMLSSDATLENPTQQSMQPVIQLVHEMRLCCRSQSYLCCQTPDFIWIWPVFPVMPSFCFNPGHTLYFVVAFPISSGPWQFLTLCFSFMTLMVLRSAGQVSCRMTPDLGLSGAFLMFKLGLWVFGKNTMEKCPSHYIISEYIISTWHHWGCKPLSLG